MPAAHPQRWAHDAEVTPPAAPLKPAIRRGGGEAPRRVLFASPVEAATQIFSPPVRAVRAVVTTTVANWAGVVQMTSVYGTTRSIVEWQREEWRREARPAIVRFSAHGVCGSGVACAARSCPPGSGTKVRCLRCSTRGATRGVRGPVLAHARLVCRAGPSQLASRGSSSIACGWRLILTTCKLSGGKQQQFNCGGYTMWRRRVAPCR